MIIRLRYLLDRMFTGAAGVAVLLVAMSLIAILLPILYRGASAVVFRGTVEFRRMQLEQFHRGNSEQIREELAHAATARQQVYDLMDRFQRGLDVSQQQVQARRIYRELRKQLSNREMPGKERAALEEQAQALRDALLAAYETTDKQEALSKLDFIAANAKDSPLADTAANQYFQLAKEYRQIVSTIDLSHRQQYSQSLQQVQQAVQGLFGIRDQQNSVLVMDRYGATRMDKARQHLQQLLQSEQWTSPGPGQPLRKSFIPREELFKGTELAGLFPLVQNHLDEMMQPRWTCYWQYFIDDSVSGHYFGGVGPEILGTLLITLLTIVIAFPLGLASAAYLVECAGDTLIVRLIRTCVDTLAGVPSIVFGLFGLAFFVIYLLPRFNLQSGSSILAGALTLSLLVLPVIIRSSEEAIKAVPQAYKEAALALGASQFRTFVTVTLPAALPGILTGVILSMSRAAGETAPILFTAAVAMGPVPASLTQPTRTLSYGSYDMAVGDRIAALVPHNQFGMVMTLILLVLILNAAAIYARSRLSRKLRGH